MLSVQQGVLFQLRMTLQKYPVSHIFPYFDEQLVMKTQFPRNFLTRKGRVCDRKQQYVCVGIVKNFVQSEYDRFCFIQEKTTLLIKKFFAFRKLYRIMYTKRIPRNKRLKKNNIPLQFITALLLSHGILKSNENFQNALEKIYERNAVF